jgi:hypothetical protein
MTRHDGAPFNGPWFLFPEIIGVSVFALSAPIFITKAFISGHVVAAIAASGLWLVAIVLAVIFIRRRHFLFVYFPMLLMGGVAFLLHHALS